MTKKRIISKRDKIEKLVLPNEEFGNDDDDYENFTTSGNTNQLLNNSVETIDYDEFSTDLKNRNTPFVFDELSYKTYGGKSVSRKELIIEDDEDFSDAGDRDSNRSETEEDATNSEGESGDDDDGEYDEPGEEEEEESNDDNEDSVDKNSPAIYSQNVISRDDETERGLIVCEQLALWESFLEMRMKMQQCLVNSNQLPKFVDFDKFMTSCEPADQSRVDDCRESLHALLDSLLKLQENLRKNCSDYAEWKNENEDPDKENEDTDTEENNVENSDSAPTKSRKRKLPDYEKCMEDNYKTYKKYSNSVIQKWDDKIRISSGRASKTNFAAFDQPILKQIEQITSDQDRIIKRTQLKRSKYDILFSNSEKQQENNEIQEYDTEIYDDDDFYHKLVREYIQRKTNKSTDVKQLGRNWSELQKLRSRMKRKIDARSTKGRKLRYDVHKKLVNFMAPINNNSWADPSITELCGSLFGKCNQ